MKLFCSLPSPFARKVRAVAAEKGFALELMEVDVLDPSSPVAALNPLRKVPCLVDDTGESWFDSSVIREWLEVEGALGELERHVTGRAFFEGDAVTLADLTVASALEWLDFRLPDRPWRITAPALAAWLVKFSKRPSFAASAPNAPNA